MPPRRTHDEQLVRTHRRLGVRARGVVHSFRSRPAPLTGRLSMPVIRTGAGIVTQINTFTVAPVDQQALIDLLTEAARFSRDTPGWISASLHRSHDGTRVVNYAQSDSLKSALHVIDRLRDAGYLERNAALATAHPGLYDVVLTLEG